MPNTWSGHDLCIQCVWHLALFRRALRALRCNCRPYKRTRVYLLHAHRLGLPIGGYWCSGSSALAIIRRWLALFSSLLRPHSSLLIHAESFFLWCTCFCFIISKIPHSLLHIFSYIFHSCLLSFIKWIKVNLPTFLCMSNSKVWPAAISASWESMKFLGFCPELKNPKI